MDKTGKEARPASTTPARQNRDESTTSRTLRSGDSTNYFPQPAPNHASEIPADPSYSWDDMNEILETSPPDLDNFGDYNHSHANQDPLSHFTFDTASPVPFTSGPSIALPSPAMTSPRSDPFDGQVDVVKPEDLTFTSSSRRCSPDTATRVNRTSQQLPSQPNNSPMLPFPSPNQMPYGYPFPFGAPYLPFGSMTFPRKQFSLHDHSP